MTDLPAGGTFLWSIVFGTFGFAAVWPMVTVVRRMGYREACDMTFEPGTTGAVHVGVTATDAAQHTLAHTILAEHRATEIHDDHDGSRL